MDMTSKCSAFACHIHLLCLFYLNVLRADVIATIDADTCTRF